MLSSMQKTLLVGIYQLNKNYITQVYCENKDKPTMHCDGKCHLEKTLEKTTKEKKSSDSILNRLTEEVIAINNIVNIHPIVLQQIKNIITYKKYNFLYYFNFENHPLKPPQSFIG